MSHWLSMWNTGLALPQRTASSIKATALQSLPVSTAILVGQHWGCGPSYCVDHTTGTGRRLLGAETSQLEFPLPCILEYQKTSATLIENISCVSLLSL